MGAPRTGPLCVAVDVGTTGARATAVDLHGRVVAEVRRPYPTTSPHPGWAEQDAGDWADHAVSALAGLVGDVGGNDRIVAVGLTGQCPTVVAVDAKFRPLAPGMMYRDNRATDEAGTMRDRIGVAEMHRRTGHTAEAFHVGPKVLWLRSHRPDVFAATRWFLQPRDVVLHRLTGRVATDESHADATLFFDLVERRWAEDLLAEFGLDPALFPAVVPSRDVAGTVTAAAAEATGLRAGLPVVIGAGDSQCVAFGAGVVDPGPVSEMAGASSCLNSAVKEPCADPRITHYSHVVADRFTTELGLNTTGAAIAWAVRQLGYDGYDRFGVDVDEGRRRLHAAHAHDAVEAAPLFLPYLGDGERDDPAARGALVGLSERHDRAAIAYSVAEGVALGVATVTGVLQDAGCPLDVLRVSGGGARLAALGRLKADILGRPVQHLDVDAAAVGVALLAGRAVGLADEVDAALAEVLSRAVTFDPAAGVGALGERRRWFDRVRESDAVHVRVDDRDSEVTQP